MFTFHLYSLPGDSLTIFSQKVKQQQQQLNTKECHGKSYNLLPSSNFCFYHSFPWVQSNKRTEFVFTVT